MSTDALQHRGTAAPHFRVPGYPLTPLGFLLPGVVVVALVAAGSPLQSLAGACAVATGLVVWPRLGAGSQRQRPTAGTLLEGDVAK